MKDSMIFLFLIFQGCLSLIMSFIHCHYVQYVHGSEENSKHWLENLWNNCMYLLILFIWKFVNTLHVNSDGSWMKFSSMILCVLKLWHTILNMPPSILPCERVFSRQNIIEGKRRKNLSLTTLNDFIWLSLRGLDSSLIEWDRVHEIYKYSTQRRVLNI